MAIKRWDVLTDLIQRYKIKSVVEIGVHRGNNMEYVLVQCPNVIWHAVDIWRKNDAYPYWGHSNHVTGYNIYCQKKKRFKDRVKEYKMLSEKAVNLFEPNSVDLVFIDGDHRYEGVRQDIELWLPRVKVSGIISGHDYHHADFPGVTKAVDEIFPDVNIGKDHVWWVKL